MTDESDHRRLVEATREAAHWKAQASNLQDIVDSQYDPLDIPLVRKIAMQRRELKALTYWMKTYQRWWRRDADKLREVEQENARLMSTNTELAQLLAATEGRADEYTRMMVGRVDEAEGIIDQIKAIRSNFPEKCEVHDEDDITCGWKSMIAGIDRVLADE